MGGDIIERHINRLTDLEGFSVVINCTGLGARPLLADEAVIPIRGQIMRVEAPWQHFCYLVNCDNATQSCYIIPTRNFVVLGKITDCYKITVITLFFLFRWNKAAELQYNSRPNRFTTN